MGLHSPLQVNSLAPLILASPQTGFALVVVQLKHQEVLRYQLT